MMNKMLNIYHINHLISFRVIINLFLFTEKKIPSYLGYFHCRVENFEKNNGHENQQNQQNQRNAAA